jgi:hypothetical protein
MELIDRVEKILLEDGIKCEKNEAERKLSAYISTGIISSRLVVQQHSRFLKALVLIPLFAPPNRRAAMAEAVCRSNYGSHFGAFEYDMDDGEVRFSASLPIVDGEPTKEALRCLTLFSCSVVSRYTDAFAQICVRAADPKTTIEAAEERWREVAREHRDEEATSLRSSDPTTTIQ